MLLLAGYEPVCIQNVKFTARKYNGLERKLFCTKWTKLSLLLTFLIEMLHIVKQWASTCANSSTTLPVMTFVSKYGCICNFCTRGKNLSNCLVLGISWLRSTSNNTKHTPWDPLVYKSSKSWVSKVLCLIPDSVLSWGLSHKGTWFMHENPSVAVPILPDTDQLWTLLGFLPAVGPPLSAADLVCMSGEELSPRSVHFLSPI